MGRFRLNKLRMHLLWFNVFLILVLSAAVNGEPKPNPKPDPKAKPKPDPKADPKAQRVLIFPPRGRDFQYNDWVMEDTEVAMDVHTEVDMAIIVDSQATICFNK